MVGYVMDGRKGRRSLVALLVAVVLAVGAAVGASSAAWASTGTWYLSGGGYNLNKTVVDNHTTDMGFTTTTVTHRVSLADQRSDGLKACTTIYVDKENDGQGWKDPKTYCDPDGYGGSNGRGWYSFKVATSWQSWDMKVVLKALHSNGTTAYSTTKYIY